jgi:uncharacterized membrane protein YhdT
MTNLGNGIFNLTLPQLPINNENEKYPIIIQCNNSLFSGISSTNSLKVVSLMFDFSSMALILLAIPFLFAYLGVRLEPSDPIKVWMKWIFISFSIIMLIGLMLFGNIIASYTGIPGLPDYFTKFIYVIAFIFMIMLFGLIKHLIFVKNSVTNNKDNE